MWNITINRLFRWCRPGQGRLDGAFCEFTENDKLDYLNKLLDFGVVNIEMESTIFGALTHHAGIRAAIVCVTLLDRMKGDQVSTVIVSITTNCLHQFSRQVNTPKEVMMEWQKRPQILVSRLIRKHLALSGLKPLVTHGSIKSPRRFKLVQQESEAHE